MTTYILGGGVTGLGAGMASGFPVLEAAAQPGGICSSYYVRTGSREALPSCPSDGEAYHFELGGGHWIFGGDPLVLGLIATLSEVRRYQRRSSVFFPDRDLWVPFPLQENLRFLPTEVATQALAEMARPEVGSVATMAEWLRTTFGKALCQLFFYPFHELYTAGLFHRVAPQDPHKSPVSLAKVIRGAFTEAAPSGYNVSFAYPTRGLDHLARELAARCTVHYESRVLALHPSDRALTLADGRVLPYDRLISTLPLSTTLEMAGLRTDSPADPHTSVLVVNVGGERGPRCPDDHWIYLPASRTGFHRVGFYSNVDASFLPASRRQAGTHVSIYVERAWPGDSPATEEEVAAYCSEMTGELQELGLLGAVDVVHPTWVDVAYTWQWPDSHWREEATRLLESHRIHPLGRYGRWTFQGIAESIAEGLYGGAALAAATGAGG